MDRVEGQSQPTLQIHSITHCTSYSLLELLEKVNRDLTAKLENISSEFEGELHLLDTLQSAFPNDKLVPKKVGVDTADIIQTVVTENGIKIDPPIVWHRKTSDKVTPSDICKAKNYKTKHNTDYSIIVTERGITTKDSENRVFGMREGIYLVHPTAVVDIARIFRRLNKLAVILTEPQSKPGCMNI